MPPNSDHPNTSSTTSDALDTVLDCTVEGLEAAKEIIVDALSVPGTGIALDAVIGILKKVQAAKSNRNGLKSLREEIMLLVKMLQRLAKVVDTELPADKYPVDSAERDKAKEEAFRSTRLAERVAKLVIDLQAICGDADKLRKRNRFSRFLHSSGDARAITDMKDRIAAARQAFQMENGVMIEDKVTEGLRGIKNAEEERILAEIPRADGAHYLSAANAMKARLQEGTRERIFQYLDEWVESQAAENRGQPVRVLVGEAGTGKSTVASEFAKRLKERGLLGASFFFTRGLTDLNSPTKFFSTVAWQLAQSQPVLRRPVVDAARQHLKTGALQQLEIQFKDLVEKPLSSLTDSEPHPPIFVVVDGLDECTEEGPQLVPSLLRLLLSAAVRPGSPLRVFLASRPEPQYIYDVFTTSDVKPHVFVTSIQEFRDTVDRDIDSLIRARLATSETSQAWSNDNPYAVSTIVDKSDGLFVYARTAVDFILSDLDRFFIQARYDALVRAQVAGLAPLDTLYRTVLEGVFPPETCRVPDIQKSIHRVLEYLVALQGDRGISARTLENLTQLRTTESIPILNKLRSVIIFEQRNVDSRFRIIHATFREFLGDPARAGNDFYVNAEEAHGRLAAECMSAMRSFAEDWQGSGADAQARLILRILTDHPPLSHVVYACAFRRTHLKLRGALSQDQDSCQSVGEDDPSIVGFESWYNDDESKLVALICTIVTQLRESLPAGSKWIDVLSSVHDALLTTQRLIDPDGYHLIKIVSIILDIQAVGNHAVSETAQGQATRTLAALEVQLVPELTNILKGFPDTPEAYDALIDAHFDFHKAIVAAGLTPGHPYEDEFDAYMERRESA